jgi:S-(hydroxymethyl)glutathione dehydrogenase/alcohol dehydrogenase
MPVKTRAAIAFAPNEPLQVREVDLADPGQGQVMIKMLATGLCHTDLHILEDKMPHRFPAILGHEGVGEIVAIGPEVEGFALGDRVIPFSVPRCGKCPLCLSGRTNLCVEFGQRNNSESTPFSLDGKPIYYFMELGTFAELSVVYADTLAKVPHAARPDHVCCIGCGITTGVGSALLRARVSPGSTVAVIGCGGVGLGAIQGARIAGASRIFAIDVNRSKEVAARASGATDFIDPAEGDLVAAIQGATGGGVDFAFDCVGIPRLSEQALEMTHPAWGVALCVGMSPQGAQVSTSPVNLMLGRSWTGSIMGGATVHDVERFVAMYMAGEITLDEVVTDRLSLDHINDGLDMIRTGQTVRAVVVYD